MLLPVKGEAGTVAAASGIGFPSPKKLTPPVFLSLVTPNPRAPPHPVLQLHLADPR